MGYGSGLAKKSGLLEYKNWVFACVRARAIAVGDIHLKLMKGDKEVDDNDVLKLLNRVNPLMTKKELFIATQSYLDLNGNAFWFLARDGNSGTGPIKEIYLLKPDRVSIVLGGDDNPLGVQGYVYKQDNAKQIPLQPNEIIHFKNFDPNGNFPFQHRGMGIVEAAQFAIETDNEIRTFNLNFFKNSAQPDGILEVSGDAAIGPVEYKRLQAEWEQEHKGTHNSHKTAILSGGLTWKETTRSQTDMQFAEQRIMNRDEILGLFNVPKTILGITEDVNFASAKATIYIYNLYTIKPLMQVFVDTLNEYLLPDFGETDLYFTFVSPVQEDRTEILSEYTQGIDKWLTRNEIRKREGLPPTENGDEIFGTFNQMVIDTAPAEKQVHAPATKTLSIVDKAVDSVLKKKGLTTKQYKHIAPVAKQAYVELWKAGLAKRTNSFKKDLRAYFEKQEKEVQKNLRAELSKSFAFTKALQDILFDKDKAVATGISLITPFIKEYLKESGDDASELVGEDGLDMESPKVQEFIKYRANYFSKTVNDTTAEDVLKKVREGIEAGKTVDEISDDISVVYEIAKGSRTDMIARTEVSAASNEGAKLAYNQAGVEMWEWAVVDPEDEDCKENEGDVVKIGAPFNDGSIQPPDPHPNCECTTLPVFDDE